MGYSIVDGAPYESTIEWASRGTYGRRHAPSGDEPSWMCDLREYRRLVTPVLQDELRAAEPSLRTISAQIAARHHGSLYLPFAFSDKRPVRATQGYLVTFPVAMLDVIPALREIPRVRRTTPAVRPPTRPRRARGAGRVADVALRKALERHAVERASDYYASIGYRREDIVDVGDYEAYDLRIASEPDELRVEVKGSSGNEIGEVEVTDGEVRNCGEWPTDLFVVDGITWWREPDGSITTAGGRARVWREWRAAPTSLRATRYRYTLSQAGVVELD